MNSMYVVTETRELYVLALALGKQAGYTILDENNPVRYTDRYYYKGYTNLVFDSKRIRGTRPRHWGLYEQYELCNLPQDLEKFTNRLFYPKKEIKVNNITKDYDATVTSQGIEVGCQLVSFDKFDELVEAVKQFKNQ
jgi:hypothetical protein